jgi:hypothetical protein
MKVAFVKMKNIKAKILYKITLINLRLSIFM